MINRKLYLELSSSYAHEHEWPYLEININNVLKYGDFIKNEAIIEIEFESLDNNLISCHYKNKRFGPVIWDTIIDENGNIVRDQYIKIKTIKIDECNLNFLIAKTLYECDNGTKIESNGFLGFNGNYNISYYEPYYDWVQSSRLANVKVIKKTSMSSLPFVTNYVYDDNNENVEKLLNEFQETIDAIKKFNSNYTIS